jgi:hypothetical protein
MTTSAAPTDKTTMKETFAEGEPRGAAEIEVHEGAQRLVPAGFHRLTASRWRREGPGRGCWRHEGARLA